MNDTGTSYLLWFIWFFGAAGLHRLYNRKFFTGILWFCTWGLFGVGQIVDLFLIPDLVEDHNLKVRSRLGYTLTGVPLNQAAIEMVEREALPAEIEITQKELTLKLLKAAQAKGGKLTVTQGVLYTECDFSEVETALREMVKTGYVAIGNDPVTGVVTYEFVEM